MKKTLLSVICSLLFVGAANAADITVYFSPTCPHCHHAREFINGKLVKELPNITVEEIDVMQEKNRPAFEAVLKTCNYDNGGVPVMVIKGKCFQGYADFMDQELRDAATADAPANADVQTEKKTDGGSKAIYFYGLLIILVAGLGFVLLGKKKKK
ncbi:MAG: hypothetical protein LBJ18_01545 [Rickettsiales bacterium]|jgi:glutaredoxin|nr:hypothetical protein [Rickettsiales bacterium]